MHYKKIWMLSILVLFFTIFPVSAYARAITEIDAAEVANNWLAMNEAPMEESMGKVIREIQHYQVR